MTQQPDASGTDLAAHFLALHRPGEPLLLPNPWDVGSARVLASLGFAALATTSSGFAATLGRPDGAVTLDQAIAHGGQIAAATPLPVTADLENGYADDPPGVAETVRLAIEAGLAGCSIEDFTGRAGDPIYEVSLAAQRVAAAAEAAHTGPRRLVLTARAENHLHGRDDLADTIARLQAYAEAGADVVYAPGADPGRRHPTRRAGREPAGQRPRTGRGAARGRAGRARRGQDLGGRVVRLRGPRRAGGGGAGAADHRDLRLLAALRHRAAGRRYRVLGLI
jgi:hypothetical protein